MEKLIKYNINMIGQIFFYSFYQLLHNFEIKITGVHI